MKSPSSCASARSRRAPSTSDGMMVARELVEGDRLEGAIERLFADPRAAYLHLHYAAAGCYAARVERA